jgi:hypothetical protein
VSRRLTGELGRGRRDLRRNDLFHGQGPAELDRPMGSHRRRGPGARPRDLGHGVAMVPFVAYRLWTAVISVLLLSGRVAVAETD